jgi:hypothetical protein
MEVTVNKHSFRKLATVGAAAALSLQLLAGVASAAQPAADNSFDAQPLVYTTGNDVGFVSTFTLRDSSTLAKLYGKFVVTGASAVTLTATAGGRDVTSSCPLAAGSSFRYDCTFKTVRTGVQIVVTLVATPSSYVTGASVTATQEYSTTGFTTSDGGASHGDSWYIPQTSTFSSDPNYAGGYGAASISTDKHLNSGNRQSAELANLPTVRVVATIRDDAACDVVSSEYDCVVINVGNGGTFSTFQLLITYYGNGAPTFYVHTYGDSTDTINECPKKGAKVDCFTWNNRSNTATIFLQHNGSIRRSG